eukprot:gene34974-45263_t
MATADILFENSASPLLCSHIAVTPCIQTLYYIIDESRGDGKCAVALGVVANLFLFPDSRLKLLEINPSISHCVIQCMLEESDPFIYSEAFRILSNMVYFGFKHLIQPHLEILATIIQFTLCNSLNLRLLAQTFQFLHFFVHEYVLNEDFETQHSVFQSLSIQNTIFELLTQNREVLVELSLETIGSCTGIEYFLSFLEDILQYLQSACSHADESIQKQDPSYWSLHPIAVEVVLQLLNGSAESFRWEEDSAARRSAGVSADSSSDLLLSVNLKFIALSILDGLLQSHVASQQAARQCEAAVMRCCMYGNGKMFAQLIGLVEEALIMREMEALRSGCSVVIALLSAGRQRTEEENERDDGQAASDESLLQYLAEWIDPVQSLTSLLGLAETKQWLQTTASASPADLTSVLGRCLSYVKQLVCRKNQAAAASASLFAIVNDIDTFLSVYGPGEL